MSDLIRYTRSMLCRRYICAVIVLLSSASIGTQLVAQLKGDSKEAMRGLGGMAAAYYGKISKEGAAIEPDKSDALNSRAFNGQFAGDQYGASVASAGDVNGDGYPDVIVGASGYAVFTGRAYIYYGGPMMDDIADVTMTGEYAGNYFGVSVAGAGDVNGDGYADVFVGANSISTYAGRAYVYFGGPAMDNIADVKMNGEAQYDSFGFSVGSAGDVNGDGYADVIVGALAHSLRTGRAYIYFGGPTMNNTADVIMTGEAASTAFGGSVSAAGDVNGDGYADVIVGADSYSSSTGKAYIFFGGPSMNNTADVTMTGEAAGSNFGTSVSAAGDVNGDGYADVVVGSQHYSSSTGRAYVYYGGAPMNNGADVVMTGKATFNQFGCSVASSGDVNGDGYADVIVGANGYGLQAGRAYIFYGGSGMNSVADKMLTGDAVQQYVGAAVACAGDINGDGYDDVLVGAYGYNSITGRVCLYQNSLTGVDIADERMIGEAAGSQLGGCVASAGDVNGDGYADVIVGALGYGTFTGRAYIFYGGPGMDSTADVVLSGESGYSFYGHSVAGAGDVNGDGYADVIVGADGYSSFMGRTYIYFGGAPMNTVADLVMTGEGTDSFYGVSVAAAGDVNGDGYADVVVGAKGTNSVTGKVYIYFGGSKMDIVSDVTLVGEGPGFLFGCSVASAGDVNRDGFADVIVGGQGYSTGTGKAYLFFGGSPMDTSPDLIMTGEGMNNAFGSSVASAGDVNRDGYADVIVGAYGYAGFTGRTYIYYGGISMNNTADVRMDGEAAGNYFGSFVASAGDVNGDGYADVMAGAPSYSNNTGRAYLYFGGSSMENAADITMTGEKPNSIFGISAAAIGDMNRNGYTDVIVGAYGYALNKGSAFVYRSSSPPIVPRIAAVADVPQDQGGVVDVRWIRSGYDARNVSRVTGYRLERSNPPGSVGFAWTTVADIAAGHNPQYNSPAPTPSVSSVGSVGNFFFRVTAITENMNEYWHSNIVAGQSVDNIPPAGVIGAAITGSVNGGVALQWNKNRTDNDLTGYAVYRDTSSGVAVNGATRLAQTSDTTFTDASPSQGRSYYYKIAALDIHGNIGAPSVELHLAVTAVPAPEGSVPTVFTLGQNYPNPFNPSTNISFSLPASSFVSLKVFDALGREIATLVSEELAAGSHMRQWNAAGMPSGVYFYRLQTGLLSETKKLLLLQ